MTLFFQHINLNFSKELLEQIDFPKNPGILPIDPNDPSINQNNNKVKGPNAPNPKETAPKLKSKARTQVNPDLTNDLKTNQYLMDKETATEQREGIKTIRKLKNEVLQKIRSAEKANAGFLVGSSSIASLKNVIDSKSATFWTGLGLSKNTKYADEAFDPKVNKVKNAKDGNGVEITDGRPGYQTGHVNVQTWQNGLIAAGCCPAGSRLWSNDGLFGDESLAETIVFQKVCSLSSNVTGLNDLKVDGTIGAAEQNLLTYIIENGLQINELSKTITVGNDDSQKVLINWDGTNFTHTVNGPAARSNGGTPGLTGGPGGNPTITNGVEPINLGFETPTSFIQKNIQLPPEFTPGAIVKKTGSNNEYIMQVNGSGLKSTTKVGELSISYRESEIEDPITKKKSKKQDIALVLLSGTGLLSYNTKKVGETFVIEKISTTNPNKVENKIGGKPGNNGGKLGETTTSNPNEGLTIPKPSEVVDASKKAGDAKEKYVNKMNEIYGAEGVTGVLFETKYSDQRVDKNSKMEIGNMLINQGNALKAGSSEQAVQKQAAGLIQAGEALKKQSEGIKTLGFKEQEEQINKLRDGKRGLLGTNLLGSKSLQKTVDKYIEKTSKALGDSLDAKVKGNKGEAQKEQSDYSSITSQIEGKNKDIANRDSSYAQLLGGKKFEDLTATDLSGARTLIQEKIGFQNDIKALEEKKITGIGTMGTRVSSYYKDHTEFLNLIKAPLQTQYIKLTEGRTSIVTKINELKAKYIKNQGTLDAILKGTYKGNIDAEIKEQTGVDVDKSISPENKEDILLNSLESKNKVLGGELRFYVGQLNGQKVSYDEKGTASNGYDNESIKTIDADTKDNTGGMNKDISDIEKKLKNIKPFEDALLNSVTYIDNQKEIEMNELRYTTALNQITTDITSYNDLKAKYDALEQSKLVTGANLRQIASDQTALQRGTMEGTLGARIRTNRTTLINLGHATGGGSLSGLNENLGNIKTFDTKSIPAVEALKSGKIFELKKTQTENTKKLTSPDGTARPMPFELQNPVGSDIISISKKIFGDGADKEKEVRKSSDKIMGMYNTLGTLPDANDVIEQENAGNKEGVNPNQITTIEKTENINKLGLSMEDEVFLKEKGIKVVNETKTNSDGSISVTFLKFESPDGKYVFKYHDEVFEKFYESGSSDTFDYYKKGTQVKTRLDDQSNHTVKNNTYYNIEKYQNMKVDKTPDSYGRIAITMEDKQGTAHKEYMYPVGNGAQFPEADEKLFTEFETKLTNGTITEDDITNEKSEFYIYVLKNYNSFTTEQKNNFGTAVFTYLNRNSISTKTPFILRADIVENNAFEVDATELGDNSAYKEVRISLGGLITATDKNDNEFLVAKGNSKDKKVSDNRLLLAQDPTKAFTSKEEFMKARSNFDKVFGRHSGFGETKGNKVLYEGYQKVLLDKVKESDSALKEITDIVASPTTLTNFDNHECFLISDNSGKTEYGFLTFINNKFEYLPISSLKKGTNGYYIRKGSELNVAPSLSLEFEKNDFTKAFANEANFKQFENWYEKTWTTAASYTTEQKTNQANASAAIKNQINTQYGYDIISDQVDYGWNFYFSKPGDDSGKKAISYYPKGTNSSSKEFKIVGQVVRGSNGLEYKEKGSDYTFYTPDRSLNTKSSFGQKIEVDGKAVGELHMLKKDYKASLISNQVETDKAKFETNGKPKADQLNDKSIVMSGPLVEPDGKITGFAMKDGRSIGTHTLDQWLKGETPTGFTGGVGDAIVFIDKGEITIASRKEFNDVSIADQDKLKQKSAETGVSVFVCPSIKRDGKFNDAEIDKTTATNRVKGKYLIEDEKGNIGVLIINDFSQFKRVINDPKYNRVVHLDAVGSKDNMRMDGNIKHTTVSATSDGSQPALLAIGQ